MRARKRFGQNFLTDRTVIDRLVTAINPKKADEILEIGPGRGALTTPLVASGCNLTLVEIDRDLAAMLTGQFPSVRLVEGDILKVDLESLLPRETRVVGNLPYNISTPLMFRLFLHLPRIKDMHFMLQREVVDRITATPGNKSYGRLSVMSQYYCDSIKLFDVAAGAFTPAPKVTSAIVRLTPANRTVTATHVDLLEKLVTQAFNKRRKTLRNAMSGLLAEAEIKSLGIDPSRRPETLSVNEFVSCANAAVEGSL